MPKTPSAKLVHRRVAPPGTPGSRTPKERAQKVEIMLLEEQAFDLRREGKTFAEIAEIQGTVVATAMWRFYRALDARTASPEDVQQFRRDETERLLALRQSIWERAMVSPDGRDQDSAINTWLKIHDRLARLHGLNAPEKVELTVTVKAQLMAVVVQRIETAMQEAGVGIEQRQQVAAALLQTAPALPGAKEEPPPS